MTPPKDSNEDAVMQSTIPVFKNQKQKKKSNENRKKLAILFWKWKKKKI